MSNVEIEQSLGEFRPRSEVYLQGGVGEPLALRKLLKAHPGTLEEVRLTSRINAMRWRRRGRRCVGTCEGKRD